MAGPFNPMTKDRLDSNSMAGGPNSMAGGPAGSRGFRIVDLYPFGGIIGIVTYILIECL